MEQVVEGLVDLGSEDAEVSVRMASSGDSMRTSDATQSSSTGNCSTWWHTLFITTH